MSIKDAWARMKDENIKTLPVTRGEKLEGLITIGDIATSYMEVYDNNILATARTQYRNIVKTLDGTLISGNEHGYFLNGKVVIAASSPDLMENFIEKDDLVILGNRYESQLCAIEMDASCLVICQGANISKTIKKMAEERDIVIIQTPHDTFTAARLINQSIPVNYVMKKDNLVTFNTEDFTDDIQDVMIKNRHRAFPVINPHGKCIGTISRRNFLDMHKKKVVLVDHNEVDQAVDNIEKAEILEIIDHHKLGTLQTMTPVAFRNEPVGCTGTILYEIYGEQRLEIPEKIAGLLCAAIISDTLMFRSPTCTQMDRAAAEALAKIAEVDIEELAKKMFEAGSDFKKKTTEELFYQDFKTFHTDEFDFGVAQLSAMSDVQLGMAKKKLQPYLEIALGEQKLDAVFVMLTDILDENSEVIYAGAQAGSLLKECFGEPDESGSFYLKGVVSRKKQMIPTLMAGLQQA